MFQGAPNIGDAPFLGSMAGAQRTFDRRGARAMRLEARPPASFSSLRAAKTALNDYQSGDSGRSSVIMQSHGSQEIHPLVLQKRLREFVLLGFCI